MRFVEREIDRMFEVDLEPIEDHRGFFARSWCIDEFGEFGLKAEWVQSNLQFSPYEGTMRGLHYQIPPHSEVKLVRCTKGSVFDVALDLRPDSPTFQCWAGTELTEARRNSVWVPAGCAHGYVTLEPESEVFYMTSHRYTPASVRGIRFDDPHFSIDWPIPVTILPPDYDSWRAYSGDDPHFWPGEGVG